ncbi:MAG: hypothetical protein ACRCW2_13120 [Cellulosilyticaceae bacterium]
MKKPAVGNAVILLGGYLVFTLVANVAAGVLVQYMPMVLLFGLLTSAMIMGYGVSKESKKWLDILFVGIPYVLGMVCYGCARLLQNGDLIKVYRTIVPAVYAQIDLMNQITFGMIQRDVLVVVTLLMVATLTYGAVRFGMWVKTAETTNKKLIYNNVLVWGVHFYMMALLGQLVLQNPQLQMDNKLRMISGGIVTLVIFIVYFVIGKYSKNLEHGWLQVMSYLSVTLTAVGMYIASLLLIYPSGRYEVYVLPVAQSFFGVIGKALATALGEKAEFISQYGIVVSILLMLLPGLLVFIGNHTSREMTLSKEQILS